MKMNLSKKNVTKACLLCLLLTASFFLGRGSAAMVQECIGTFSVSGQVDNWGLGFGESGSETQPTGNVSAEELKKNKILIERDDLLNSDDIHVYQFVNDMQGKSIVEELEFKKVPCTGYDFSLFNDSTMNLFEEAKIAMRIDDEN